MSAKKLIPGQPTWKDVVYETLKLLGRPARPKEISDLIAGHPKCRTNPTWRATVRRTLQQYTVFEPLGDKRWRLRSPAELQRVEVTKLNHTLAQGLLLELGRLYGYETYTPDLSRAFRDAHLGDVATLQRMPVFTYPRIIRHVGKIDVLWFYGGTDELVPSYAFEVEHTTGVAPGLLRLYQLFQVRGRETKLFVILPEHLRSKFEQEVVKEPYRRIREYLLQRTYEQLAALHEMAVGHAPLKKEFLAE